MILLLDSQITTCLTILLHRTIKNVPFFRIVNVIVPPWTSCNTIIFIRSVFCLWCTTVNVLLSRRLVTHTGQGRRNRVTAEGESLN